MGIRNQESGIRNQESGIRNQESGISSRTTFKKIVGIQPSKGKAIEYVIVFWQQATSLFRMVRAGFADHIGGCFAFCCLLAVLLFSPKVSYASTVQGTTAYSSSDAAQAQINALIAGVIAAHPGATQSGNSVQWEEGGYGVERSVERTFSIRGGENFFGWAIIDGWKFLPPIVIPGLESRINDNVGLYRRAGSYPPHETFRREYYQEILALCPATYTVEAGVFSSTQATVFTNPRFGDLGQGNFAIVYDYTIANNGGNGNYAMFIQWTGHHTNLGAAYYIDYQDTEFEFTITLSGGDQIEPSKGSTINSLAITATVIDKTTNQPPSTPVKVRISLKVDPWSGGHDHGDSTRPRGSIGSAPCTTDATCTTLIAPANSGVVTFDFNPIDASGKHTITASCDKCSNDDSKAVEVKVEGLIQIPDAIIRYAQFDSDGAIGAKPSTHEHNHYLTPASIIKLNKLADVYAEVNPGFRLFLNDASLEWGGLFDVGTTRWKKPHKTHRRGKSLDIRAASAAGRKGEVPANKFMKFINEAAKENLTVGLHCLDSSDTNDCLGQPNNRHFHVDF